MAAASPTRSVQLVLPEWLGEPGRLSIGCHCVENTPPKTIADNWYAIRITAGTNMAARTMLKINVPTPKVEAVKFNQVQFN